MIELKNTQSAENQPFQKSNVQYPEVRWDKEAQDVVFYSKILG